MKEKVKPIYAASRLERTSYYLYFTGQNFLYFLLTSFLSIYYTGSLGIPATVVAAILLAARVWDAFVDPILAAVIEKSHFKGGKFKPWVRLAAITVPILTISCFGFTDFLTGQSLGIRITYATITYFIWGTAYAAADAPAYALATVMTSYPEERNQLLTFNKITGMIGIIIAMAGVPMVLNATNNNYLTAAIVFSMGAFVTMIIASIVVKERVPHDPTRHPSIKDMASSIVKNKYLLLNLIITIISNGTNFALTLTAFVGNDIYHSSDAITTIMMTTMLPMLVVAVFIPRLIRKFGKIKLFAFALGATVIFSILQYFMAKESLNLFLILNLFKGLFSAPLLVVSPLFFTDTIEFDEYQNGTRFEAVTFAAQSFSSKIVAAVSGGLGMWIIGIAGYKAAVAGQTITQTPTALHALWATMNLGPAIGALLTLIIFLKFYDLTDEKVKIMVEENMRNRNK